MMLICGHILWWKSKAVKSLKCSTWMQCQKWQNDTYSFPRQTIQYQSNPSLCLTSNSEEAEVELFNEDLQDLEFTPKKDVFFIIGDWNTKVGSQETPGVQANLALEYKMNQVLPRECTDHRKHCLPTTQEKTLDIDITRWSMQKPDWLYSLQPKMEKLSTVSKNKTGSRLWLRSWTPYCQIQTEIEESRENH